MWKKSMGTGLTVVLAASLLAACGNDNAAENPAAEGTKGEEVYTVNFAYHAPKEGNQAEVNELINELTMRDLNMKVNLMPITWDTYNSKMPMMLAAQEPIDISFVFAFSLPSFIDQGYIVDASDYLEQTKDLQDVLGEDLQGGYIGDMLAGFPMMNVRATPSGIFVRKDIFEELGYEAADFNITTDDMSSFNQLTELFAEVKEKYPDMTPFNGYRTFGLNTITYIDGVGDQFGALENYGQTDQITNWYESDQYKQFALLNREWFEKGYSSKDIAVDKELGQAKMKAGKTFAFFASYGANALTDVKSQTGYDTVLIPVSDKMKSTTAVNGALNVVLNTSANKEKAFEFLNWAYTNKEFNDLLNWGVPGKDWIVNDQGQADYPEGASVSTVNYHNDFGFIYPNQYLMTPWSGSPEGIWEKYKAFSDDALVSKAYGFTFDSSAVATEQSQLAAVLAKYEDALAFGAVDIEPTLKKFNDELYAAGLQAVMDEKQRQLDEWLASK
ncbi:ABC transporter substrate-binding protein [Paenibacillus daejeonensis]|uniref:ABC transporter substrate-binding protein n=1 Tax=Paenibacillus daejeonensis TaxID=135193 RepID=UPI000363EE16|nr:ABC transporter substrate-binding protein [Paenibacillus daejeonensis]